jgi:hypothetical protein
MIFTNIKSQHSYIGNKINEVKTINNKFSILMPKKNTAQIVSNNVKTMEEIEIPKLPKKMKWGEPTWYLLHCLAEKVKEEVFTSIRIDLLNLIFTICSNLPCPDCANHASEYLKNINYLNIQTKQQLKNMLYNFHNTVNAKKRMPIFPRHELEVKYINMNFIQVIHTFMVHFEDKHKSIRMIANDFHRSRISQSMKQWFNNNISNFYP